jgi:hypothetical protein
VSLLLLKKTFPLLEQQQNQKDQFNKLQWRKDTTRKINCVNSRAKKENYQWNCLAKSASVVICRFIAAAFALNKYIKMQMFIIWNHA